jgi:hypothetical protein
MSQEPKPKSQKNQTNFSKIYREMTTPRLISEAWDNPDSVDPKVRDRIVATLMKREQTEGGAAWPSAAMQAREEMAGLYPDTADPQFAARLYQKREFYEARAVAAAVADGEVDPCTSAAAERVFELTPVQRLVSRFMHPLTPYMGLLLFHGVGVGKTCAAVTIAEQFLEATPANKVIVLVPQALKENYKRTVVDPSKLEWDAATGQWQSRQCTGLAYLERLGLLHNPDIKAVTFKLEEDRRNRYTVTGYQAFANWIDRTLKKNVPMVLTDPDVRRAAENEVLRRLFSDHLIIVDEAHNLRDLAAGSGSGSGSSDAVAGGEAAENQGGKALNPFLRRIVVNAEGLRLVLMTATPMYNLASEIVLLLNYLIMNDAKSEKAALAVSDIFTKDGALLKPTILEKFAKRYVSYMRGENPYTFPLRMHPVTDGTKPAAMWPAVSATKNPVILNEEDTAALNALPLVFTEPLPGSPVEVQLRAATARGAAKVKSEEGSDSGSDSESDSESESESEPKPGQVDAMLDQRMQMGNISYPNSLYGGGGFDFFFTRSTIAGAGHKLRVFTPKGFDVDTVFSGAALQVHAPKIHRIVESVKAAKGISFVYSRYIKAGALPIAFALERAGFQRRLADGRLSPLLVGVGPVAPVCAICGSTAAGHPAAAANHSFSPACYVLLTSEDDLSPNFAGIVRQATTWLDDGIGPLGANVKVIIGSQVASEGLDLKCIREMHIMDSWYHLNRTDQIIGRAIRYCSHTALRAVEQRQGLPPMSLNNCQIFLHAIRVSESAAGPAFETADMYAYRLAIGKAQMVGRVQRLLKTHAWDCNLEMEAITFAGLPPRVQIDSQGRSRKSLDAEGREMDGYSINDQDYTTYCDYQRCAHQCAITVPPDSLKIDMSTFGIGDARRLVLAKQALVRKQFEDQVIVPESTIQQIFSDLPWEIASNALMELIDGRRFKLRRRDNGVLIDGFLVKKPGFLVFQPADITDSDIPMTMRYSRAFQLGRHYMTPRLPVLARSEEVEPLPVIAAAAGPGPGLSVEPRLIPAVDSQILKEWTEWVAFVDSKGRGPLPKKIPATNKLWIWLLKRYADIPEVRAVALRWWFDKLATFAEQKFLLEAAISDEGTLRETLKGDIFISPKYIVYRIFNPEEGGVEYLCKGAKAEFSPCASNIAKAMGEKMGVRPIRYLEETGPLFGFIVAKGVETVFKTLDTTKPMKKSSIGAVCETVSNMGEHQPRVQLLHAAGLSSDLAALMIPDDDASWKPVPKGFKPGEDELGPPFHMLDLTQRPLCLYMEFLTRLFDARRLAGKRWFLSAVESSYSGLKGTGGKK